MTHRSRLASAALCCVLAAGSAAHAQGSAGTGATVEPRFIVDCPTAGLLGDGALALDGEAFADGGLLLGVQFGLFDRFTLGISYGGAGLVGGGEPVMNPLPGVSAKFRFVNESEQLPAIVLGFDSQGKDGYDRSRDRYRIKSPGLYAAASKNWILLGNFALHAGANYSFERADDDRDVNAFFGAEKSLGPWASLTVEYNLALNDSRETNQRGYFNVGLAVAPLKGLTFAFLFKDLLENAGDIEVANRVLRLEFVWPG